MFGGPLGVPTERDWNFERLERSSTNIRVRERECPRSFAGPLWAESEIDGRIRFPKARINRVSGHPGGFPNSPLHRRPRVEVRGGGFNRRGTDRLPRARDLYPMGSSRLPRARGIGPREISRSVESGEREVVMSCMSMYRSQYSVLARRVCLNMTVNSCERRDGQKLMLASRQRSRFHRS